VVKKTIELQAYNIGTNAVAVFYALDQDGTGCRFHGIVNAEVWRVVGPAPHHGNHIGNGTRGLLDAPLHPESSFYQIEVGGKVYPVRTAPDREAGNEFYITLPPSLSAELLEAALETGSATQSPSVL
jgi:hypothetical protein